MKQLAIIIALMMVAAQASADPKLWVSNKITIGYDDYFVSEKVKLQDGRFVSNEVELGRKFEITKNVNFKLSYLLNHSLEWRWKPAHILGVNFELEFPLDKKGGS